MQEKSKRAKHARYPILGLLKLKYDQARHGGAGNKTKTLGQLIIGHLETRDLGARQETCW